MGGWNVPTVEELRDMGPDEIVSRFAEVEDPAILHMLTDTVASSEWDHELKAYMPTLGIFQQAALMEALLPLADDQPLELRTEICASLRAAVEGYWIGFEPFTTILLRNSKRAAALLIVGELVGQLLFSAQLLKTMLEEHEVIDEWVAMIHERREAGTLEGPELEYEDELIALDALLAQL